jgi:hypothetical protein
MFLGVLGTVPSHCTGQGPGWNVTQNPDSVPGVVVTFPSKDTHSTQEVSVGSRASHSQLGIACLLAIAKSWGVLSSTCALKSTSIQTLRGAGRGGTHSGDPPSPLRSGTSVPSPSPLPCPQPTPWLRGRRGKRRKAARWPGFGEGRGTGRGTSLGGRRTGVSVSSSSGLRGVPSIKRDL